MSRILIATHPFDGHFNPLTSLAVHLVERGHDVRWYTGQSYAKKLAKLHIPHYPFRRAREINANNLAEHFPEYDDKPMSPKMMELGVRELFFAPIETQLADVRDIHASGFAFDAFVCDTALHLSQMVAETLQPRVYVVSPAPTPAPTSPTSPAPFFGFRPARTFMGRARDRAMKALLERMTRSGMALYNDLRRREGLPLYRGSMFDMHVEKSRAIFQVGVPGLDYPRSDWPANLQFIGALLPHRSRAREGEGALPADVERKCDRYRSLVVVSQGTTDNRDPEKLFEPSLQALARTEHLVVVTTGGRHTDALRARFAHDNVVVEDWIDFHALLPRASAFLTNGGFGSVLLALSYGVPLLLAGKLEGKADINARVAWAGAGVDLRTERPTPAQIVRGLARVVGNGDEACRIRTGVARVRAELARFDACEIVRAKLEADGVVGGIEARLQRDRMVDAGQDAGQGRA